MSIICKRIMSAPLQFVKDHMIFKVIIESVPIGPFMFGTEIDSCLAELGLGLVLGLIAIVV